ARVPGISTRDEQAPRRATETLSSFQAVSFAPAGVRLSNCLVSLLPSWTNFAALSHCRLDRSGKIHTRQMSAILGRGMNIAVYVNPLGGRGGNGLYGRGLQLAPFQ